jgi:hypothetical protein
MSINVTINVTQALKEITTIQMVEILPVIMGLESATPEQLVRSKGLTDAATKVETLCEKLQTGKIVGASNPKKFAEQLEGFTTQLEAAVTQIQDFRNNIVTAEKIIVLQRRISEGDLQSIKEEVNALRSQTNLSKGNRTALLKLETPPAPKAETRTAASRSATASGSSSSRSAAAVPGNVARAQEEAARQATLPKEGEIEAGKEALKKLALQFGGFRGTGTLTEDFQWALNFYKDAVKVYQTFAVSQVGINIVQKAERLISDIILVATGQMPPGAAAGMQAQFNEAKIAASTARAASAAQQPQAAPSTPPSATATPSAARPSQQQRPYPGWPEDDDAPSSDPDDDYFGDIPGLRDGWLQEIVGGHQARRGLSTVAPGGGAYGPEFDFDGELARRRSLLETRQPPVVVTAPTGAYPRGAYNSSRPPYDPGLELALRLSLQDSRQPAAAPPGAAGNANSGGVSQEGLGEEDEESQLRSAIRLSLGLSPEPAQEEIKKG